MKRILELRSLSTDKLKNMLGQINTDLHRARMHKKSWMSSTIKEQKQGTDTKFEHRLKKKKARILTILNERRNNKRW